MVVRDDLNAETRIGRGGAAVAERLIAGRLERPGQGSSHGGDSREPVFDIADFRAIAEFAGIRCRDCRVDESGSRPEVKTRKA